MSNNNEKVIDKESLNNNQLNIFNEITSEKINHVFISGTAGTGKSILLKTLLKHYGIKCCVVAVSAIAARHVEGRTIHSVFKFDLKGEYPKIKRVEINNKKICKGRLSFPFEILIIDEVSMLSNILFDKIDECLRHHCDSFLPFAGKRVICFGDLFQLEPVNNSNDNTLPENKPVFFAKSWSYFKYRELTQNMRQSEELFIKNLNLLREGESCVLKYFNKFMRDITLDDRLNSLTLFSTNNDAKICNEYLFSIVSKDKEIKTINISREEIKVNDEDHGFAYPKNSLNSMFHDSMDLCIGTRIMFTKNNQGYLNGETGVIIDLKENLTEEITLQVKKDDGKIVDVKKEKVLFDKSDNKNKCVNYRIIFTKNDENQTYLKDEKGIIINFSENDLTVKKDDGEIINIKKEKVKDKEKSYEIFKLYDVYEVYGFPIIYGWACTIHKIQGITTDKLILDKVRMFANGQLYVALSRVKTSDGIYLGTKITKRSIKYNEDVKKEYERLRQKM